MLHFKGVITEQRGIKTIPIGSNDKESIETLLYYDDELCDEKSCFLIEKQLQEHFKSEIEDIHIQVYYDNEDKRVTIAITIFFDRKEDKSRLSNYKSSFEKYYKKHFTIPIK
jgi:hypothetical protein